MEKERKGEKENKIVKKVEKNLKRENRRNGIIIVRLHSLGDDWT
jgi:hypothetical protein